ncbi:MAG: thermonuclease family protein, partial [Proteobacteria bacterium]|nr:thermonuclease family protein [Pseudomonadota bacterium]
MQKKISALLLALFLSCFLYGNIYFWTDETGTRHYSNTSPPSGENVQELEESHEIFKKITALENKGHHFKVLRIYDGDTIQVKGLGLVFKVRMVGIDAPEIQYDGQQSQPFSQKAKAYLITLLENKNIHLKSYGTGGYNRQLAEVFV